MTLAVLTGDIVKSSAFSRQALDAVMQSVATAQTEISHWLYPDYASFARREGDGWQMALLTPKHALRAALHIRANLRRDHKTAQTRIALALGAGQLPETGNLNAAHGPVFTTSGRLLDAIEAPTLMAHASGGAVAATTVLVDHISQGWTQAQARTLALMLRPDPPTHTAVAAELGIKRQAVDQALRAAGFPAIKAALAALEDQP